MGGPETTRRRARTPSGAAVVCTWQGEKVVWQRTVYEAKWWTHDDPPDQRVANEWDTPWRTVGPVLPSDARASEGGRRGEPAALVR